MKEAKIKVLALLPMELPKEIKLDNTLEAMQNFVGGLIECITLSDTGVTSAQNSRWSAMMKANYWNCRRTGCSGAAQIIWLVLVSSPEQTVRAT